MRIRLHVCTSVSKYIYTYFYIHMHNTRICIIYVYVYTPSSLALPFIRCSRTICLLHFFILSRNQTSPVHTQPSLWNWIELHHYPITFSRLRLALFLLFTTSVFIKPSRTVVTRIIAALKSYQFPGSPLSHTAQTGLAGAQWRWDSALPRGNRIASAVMRISLGLESIMNLVIMD